MKFLITQDKIVISKISILNFQIKFSFPREMFKMRVLTPKIKTDISKRDFLKRISKMEVSISQMGTPNIERNFDFQHDLWNNVSISKIGVFIFKMNF